MKRSAGVLMHISSLPGKYGVGTFGREAYAFVDFIKCAGLKYWQTLPLGPTGYGDSPYQSFSSFAINPSFIDPELLCEAGLLTAADCDALCWGSDPASADFDLVREGRDKLLRIAYHNYTHLLSKAAPTEADSGHSYMPSSDKGILLSSVSPASSPDLPLTPPSSSSSVSSLSSSVPASSSPPLSASAPTPGQLSAFVTAQSGWLPDYALYMAMKRHFEGLEWQSWDEDIKKRTPKAVARYTQKYQEEISYWYFVQYLAYDHWQNLKSYANRLGISIIGDIPIYAANDSADTWSNAGDGIFKYDKALNPIGISGCPPDYFCEDGQYWANPVYDWAQNQKTGYRWWLMRLENALTIFDTVRIDHFRGLESYWEIPFGALTAKAGSWQPGPGMDFIRALKQSLRNPSIIAEDLGLLTPAVKKLRRESRFPGMKVLLFAFDSGYDNDYLPHNLNRNCVIYTGTHDNDTVQGWRETAPSGSLRFAKQYLKLTDHEGWHWGFIRSAWSSIANLAIAPMQDFLGLGSESRMNTPSTLGGTNWKWRLLPDQLTFELAGKISKMSILYGRSKR